jgi:hypothetical protein
MGHGRPPSTTGLHTAHTVRQVNGSSPGRQLGRGPRSTPPSRSSRKAYSDQPVFARVFERRVARAYPSAMRPVERSDGRAP